MAFQYVFTTLLAATALLFATANGGVIGPITYAAAPVPVVAKVANPAVDAVASTHQNVVRSFGGTVSQYSKAIDTPYSSVRKEDTRISNNVYTPRTVAYAAPIVTKNVAANAAVYTHSAPTAAVYTDHHEPTAVYTTHHEQAQVETLAAPTPAAVYTHAAPVATKTVAYSSVPAAEPAQVYHNYHHQAPAVATTTYNHGPDASTYTHNAPGIAAYGTSQTVHYSPAEMVSHMSFDGFGTHWGF